MTTRRNRTGGDSTRQVSETLYRGWHFGLIGSSTDFLEPLAIGEFRDGSDLECEGPYTKLEEINHFDVKRFS
jgi:hypothetical protein